MTSLAYALSDADLLYSPVQNPNDSAWKSKDEVPSWKVLARGNKCSVELVLDQQPPRWATAIVEEFVELLDLPEGWDSYDARPTDADAIRSAIYILFGSYSKNMPRPSIVPTTEGGIQLEWHGKLDVEIEVHPNGQVGFLAGDTELIFDTWPAAARHLSRVFGAGI